MSLFEKTAETRILPKQIEQILDQYSHTISSSTLLQQHRLFTALKWLKVSHYIATINTQLKEISDKATILKSLLNCSIVELLVE